MLKFFTLILSFITFLYISGSSAITECQLKCYSAYQFCEPPAEFYCDDQVKKQISECKKNCENAKKKKPGSSNTGLFNESKNNLNPCIVKCPFDDSELPKCAMDNRSCNQEYRSKLSKCKQVCKPYFVSDTTEFAPAMNFMIKDVTESEKCPLTCPFDKNTIPHCVIDDTLCVAKRGKMLAQCNNACK